MTNVSNGAIAMNVGGPVALTPINIAHSPLMAPIFCDIFRLVSMRFRRISGLFDCVELISKGDHNCFAGFGLRSRG
jgi:hypothetical protein